MLDSFPVICLTTFQPAMSATMTTLHAATSARRTLQLRRPAVPQPQHAADTPTACEAGSHAAEPLTIALQPRPLNDANLQVRSVDSASLLAGHKTVQIAHNGSVYTLQATKLGKLILTK